MVAHVDTVRKAEAQNKALRDVIKDINVETKAGKKQIDEYNKIIEKNTKLIDANADSDKKRIGGIGKYQQAIENVGKKVLAFLAVDQMLKFGKAAFQAFEAQEVVNRKLLYALQGDKVAYKDLQKQAEQLQKSLGIPDETINGIQMMAAETGRSTEEIKRITQASVTLSAVTGGDLQTSYETLNGTYAGVLKGLKRIDPAFSNLTKEQLRNGEAIDLVISKYGNIAQEATTPTKRLSAAWEEFMETLGSAESGPIQWVTERLIGMIDALQGVYKWMFKFKFNREGMLS